jgi:hypothetical protein
MAKMSSGAFMAAKSSSSLRSVSCNANQTDLMVNLRHSYLLLEVSNQLCLRIYCDLPADRVKLLFDHLVGQSTLRQIDIT